MAHLHAEAIVWTLRVYDRKEGDGHAERAVYDVVMTVMILNDTAWVSGMKGKFNRRIYRALHRWFRERGIRRVLMERRQRIIVIEGA